MGAAAGVVRHDDDPPEVTRESHGPLPAYDSFAMPTLHDSLVSSSARALPMRMRPDLTATQQRYQGRLYWVVKEPVGLHYFRFQEEEYAILQDARRPDRASTTSRTAFEDAVSAAKNHGRRAGAIRRHAAPQRPGDRRRARPGRAAQEAPRRAQAARSCWPRWRNILAHPLQGHRSRSDAELAVSAR